MDDSPAWGGQNSYVGLELLTSFTKPPHWFPPRMKIRPSIMGSRVGYQRLDLLLSERGRAGGLVEEILVNEWMRSESVNKWR